MKKTFVSALFLLALTASDAGLAQAPQQWTASWASPPIGYEPNIKNAIGRPFDNETVRQTVWSNASGSALRIRFTNELSDKPLVIGAASIARVDAQGNVMPGTLRVLHFGGSDAVTIPSGAPFYSDSIAMPVKRGETFVVNVYYPDSSAPPAHAHMMPLAPGNQTAAITLSDAKTVRVPGIVSDVEVSDSPSKRVLVAFGDSITEGAAASSPRMSWPQQLQGLLARDSGGKCWSVVDAGISGNRILHDGRGPAALGRFDRDVLAVPGVNTVVLLEGINDIGASDMNKFKDQAVTADQIIESYRQFIARAHAKGVRIIGATLTPYEGAIYQSAAGEKKREKVNAWIRSSHAFDGVIDFEKAMEDPSHPTRMIEKLQSGDHLHPNDAGYSRMAKTAESVILKDRCPA